MTSGRQRCASCGEWVHNTEEEEKKALADWYANNPGLDPHIHGTAVCDDCAKRAREWKERHDRGEKRVNFDPRGSGNSPENRILLAKCREAVRDILGEDSEFVINVYNGDDNDSASWTVPHGRMEIMHIMAHALIEGVHQRMGINSDDEDDPDDEKKVIH